MQPTTTKRFQTLTLITVAFIFLLITVGGIVRVTGSGLGCPDWPLCYGQVVPPREVTAWIEFSHRVVAAIGGGFILVTAATIWRNYREITLLRNAAIAQTVLLVFQVPLGGIIVFSELEPLAVATHLGKAMLIFALSIVIAVAAHRHDAGRVNKPRIRFTRRYVALLGGAALAAFLLLMTGALVVGTQSSYACPGWPLCNGSIFPAEGANFRLWVQMGHRYTVAAVSILLTLSVFVTLRRSEEQQAPGAKLWSVLLIALLVGQIVVGAVQVITHLQWYWRALHLSMASAVWAALVALTATTLINGVLEPAKTRMDGTSIAPSPGK
jgi:heme A synthase